MALHKNIPYDCNHVAHSYEFTDESTRITCSGYDSTDIGRIARQTDNDSWWILSAISGVDCPVWEQIDGGAGSVASINDIGDVDTTISGLDIGDHLIWDGTSWVSVAPAANIDERVKVTDNDTATGYLFDKIVSTEGIQQTELNDGSDEDLELKLDLNTLTADATPDSAADYLVTYDASAGTHKKVLLSDLPAGTGTGKQDAYAFVDNATTKYSVMDSATYTEGATIIFRGSNVTGALQSVKVVAQNHTNDKAWDLRIFDVTNAQIICELLNQDNNDKAIYNLGAISNVPAGEAMLEIQGRKNAINGGAVRMYSLVFQF